jgi:hypothetical protein
MHHIGFRYRMFILLHGSSLLDEVVHASYACIKNPVLQYFLD